MRKTRLLGGRRDWSMGFGRDPDAGQPVLGLPGAGGDLDVHGEGIGAGGGRRGVIVGEVVEQLLDADGVRGREHALGEEAADVGVAGRVHVDRERRERLGRRCVEGVLGDRGVGLGVRRFFECGTADETRFQLFRAALSHRFRAVHARPRWGRQVRGRPSSAVRAGSSWTTSPSHSGLGDLGLRCRGRGSEATELDSAGGRHLVCEPRLRPRSLLARRPSSPSDPQPDWNR